MTGRLVTPAVLALTGCTIASAAGAAAPALTIGARPTAIVAFEGSVLIYGSLAGGAGGRTVRIEAQECGTSGAFHLVGGTTTATSGAFSATLPLAPGATTRYRARSADSTSNVVSVRVAPLLTLRHNGSRFTVVVSAHGYLRGRRVVLQRLVGGTWTRARAIRLTETFGTGAIASARVAVHHGALLRAVLSRAEAAPCFLGAISNTVRT